MHLFKRIQKHLPSHKHIEDSRYMSIFGSAIKHQQLWTINRFSSSRGVAIGLFCAFLPMPFEMLTAIFLCLLMRANLPLALAGVWISNPLTWVPLYTPCYLVGSKILGLKPIPIEHISIITLGWHYVALWLGCLLAGSVLAYLSFTLINYFWRTEVAQRWEQRRRLRLARKKAVEQKSD